MKWLKIKQEKVNIKNAPKEFNNLSILHISDIHNASKNKVSLNIWEKINELQFDIVVITGDMTVSGFSNISPLIPHLKNISKRCPVFFVDGNHEKEHYEEIKQLLEGAGVKVLNNEKVTVNIKGCELPIIGLRDYYTLQKGRFKEFKNLFMNEEKDSFRIILQHQPQIIDKLEKFSNLLIFSGHTHGGQVRIPFFPTLFAPGQGILPKYGDGMYHVGNNILYISRGIGTTTFKIRFFNRPEIAVIKILC